MSSEPAVYLVMHRRVRLPVTLLVFVLALVLVEALGRSR
jgi:hypothetical protein